MPRTTLVVVGASAGGVQALDQLLPQLPADLPAAVVIVLHRLAVGNGERLPRLLSRHSKIPVHTIEDGEPIRPTCAYVAPAGMHVEIVDDSFRLTAGPRENSVRPSIDVLFRTAAEAHGRKVVGVLLSGLLDDGTAGLAAIKAAGGYAIAQDPNDAQYADMPRNAILNVQIDTVCPLSEMGHTITHALERMTIPLGGRRKSEGSEPSSFSCPDCGGVLRQLDQDGLLHYRCRVGHSYSPASLYLSQDGALEAAL